MGSKEAVVADEQRCPECDARRPDFSKVCPACGAPPVKTSDHRDREEEVRGEDLEPYVTLRYIALLFKVLAVLVLVMLIGEVALGLMRDGTHALTMLIGEASQLLVIGCVLWAAGDIAVLLVDAGHDLRVARILLGRINSALHEQGQRDTAANTTRSTTITP
jgi:hypothetical protein